jgi:hypothetical protein
MKLLGARANETSTDLALEDGSFIIFPCRLNLLIEERYTLREVQFVRA